MASKHPEEPAAVRIDELGPQKFSLSVTIGDQVFDCGLYLNRAAAMQAGRLFVERKEGEAAGRRKHPLKKKH
jgi:hypothetical protein